MNTLVSYSKKSLPKIKAEIKAIKEKPPSRANQRVFYEQEKPINLTKWYMRLSCERINKQCELVSKQGMSVSEYSRYEHHQAVKEQRPDLAQASYEATAWDKETQRLQAGS